MASYSDELQSNRFKEDGKADKMKRKKKRVYNRATGKHQEPAKDFDSTAWWKRKLGFGNKKGEGALAKRRKETVDSNVKAAGG